MHLTLWLETEEVAESRIKEGASEAEEKKATQWRGDFGAAEGA